MTVRAVGDVRNYTEGLAQHVVEKPTCDASEVGVAGGGGADDGPDGGGGDVGHCQTTTAEIVLLVAAWAADKAPPC